MTSRAYRREERWRSGRSGEIRKERGEQMGGTCHNDKPGLKKKNRCCLGKIPGGAPFSQLHKSDVDRP